MFIDEAYICTTPGCDCLGMTNDEYIQELLSKLPLQKRQEAEAMLNILIKKRIQ